MNIPENLKYTADHEWIKIDGNQATIGITDYAQGELGDIVFIDIDTEMEKVVKGDSFGTIEAVKTVSDMFAPCNGKVIEVNSTLEDQPEIINSDPYGDGWIIKIELENVSELDELMDSISYQAQITA